MFKKPKQNTQKGFTLVELIVSIAIIGIIIAVILFNNADARDKIALKSSAYDVVLALREAQLQAIGVAGAGSSNDDFESGYGVEIDQGENKLTIFENRCFGDNEFDPSGNCTDGDGNTISDQLIREIDIEDNNFIYEVCLAEIGDTSCDLNGGDLTTVTFIRPDADAIIYDGNDTDAEIAYIRLQSPQGAQKQVIITKSGQISIEDL